MPGPEGPAHRGWLGVVHTRREPVASRRLTGNETDGSRGEVLSNVISTANELRFYVPLDTE